MNSHSDTIIIGGGIAGLWMLNRLRAKGYGVTLIEKTALAAGQTIAAQGVLHGGIKYTLQGKTTGHSELMGSITERWNSCLAGSGEADLQSVRVLAEHQVLWAHNSLTSRLTGFFASKAIKSRVEAIGEQERPAVFDHPDFRGSLYRIHEKVVHVPDVVAALAAPHRNCIVQADPILESDTSMRLGELRLSADRIILAAGAGNEALMGKLGLSSPSMQRRPLHQVMLTKAGLPPLHVVALGNGPKPRVVATSHPAPNDQTTWYLGGSLAETTTRSDVEQIAFAQAELAELLPWIDLSEAKWETLRIDRAEPAQGDSCLPSGVFCQAAKNLIVTWPTKLVLAPLLADAVLDALPPPSGQQAELDLPSPLIAPLAWSR